LLEGSALAAYSDDRVVGAIDRKICRRRVSAGNRQRERIKGCILLIGTTNFDTQRPVMWGHGPDRDGRQSRRDRPVPQDIAGVGDASRGFPAATASTSTLRTFQPTSATPATSRFDQKYMIALFDRGYDLASHNTSRSRLRREWNW
jgi:hypothetical protein